MRVAFASPFRPQASGVSDYSAELLPELAAHADVTLVTDRVTPSDAALADLPRLDLSDLPARAAAFDAILYHIGNAPLYHRLYERALTTPGIVVLHDVVLHHLRAWQTLERGNRAAYEDALRRAYGAAVAEQARQNAAALDRFAYPLSEELLQAARGAIVHSEYAAAFVHRAAPQTPVAVVPMGVALAPERSRADARARLGLDPASLVVGAFGEVHPHKRITPALDAFAEIVRRHPGARLLLVGSASPNYALAPILQTLQLESVVRQYGFVPMDEYQDLVAACDVCLNLRYPSAGETSASLLRLLGAGRVTLVTRTAAYAELPDAVCVKIEPDAHEKELLVEYLDYFAVHPHARAVMEQRARAFVATQHTLRGAAQAYVAFLEQFRA